MSNLTTIPLQGDYETTLSQEWDWLIGTIFVANAPDFTFPGSDTTYIIVDAGTTNAQLAEINAVDTALNTITVSSISSLELWESISSITKVHATQAKVLISDNFQFWKDIKTAINSKLDSDWWNPTTTFDLKVSWSSWRIRKDWLDMKFTDDNNSEISLSTIAAAAWVDQKVWVTLSDTTPATLNAKVVAWDWIATSVLNPAGDEDLQFVVDILSGGWLEFESGKLRSRTKFGWDWTDWAISWALTVTWANDAYIVKNFTTFAPWANIVTITPTNSILHIKVQWDCDLSDTTFNFDAKWATGGAWGAWETVASWDAVTGTVWSLSSQSSLNKWTAAWGGIWNNGWTVWASIGWSSAVILITAAFMQWSRWTQIAPWAGWGGWGGWAFATNWGWLGWTWWTGGWAVILEVWWDLTFSSTTGNFNWAIGTAWASEASDWGWGWGWGWAGWMFLSFFNGTLTWSLTPTVAGWAGWAGGTWSFENGWGGWAGWYSLAASWTDWAWTGSSTWWAGWAWAAGLFLIEKNEVFN